VDRINWDGWLVVLSLVKLGQDLGTDSTMARCVYDLVTIATAFAIKYPS